MAGTTTSWKEMPPVPTGEELLSPHDSALPQILEHAPMVKDDYLEAEYLLHRHEVTASLRSTVQQIRHQGLGLHCEDAKIYTHVRILGFRPTKSGLAWRIVWTPDDDMPEFLTPSSETESLTSGTLLALTPKDDCFRTKCLVATVAQPERAETLAGGETATCEIIWARAEDTVFDPAIELIMLEPKSGYFEPSRHTMTGLQLAASSNSRYDKYLFKPNDDASEKREPIALDEPVRSHFSAEFLRMAPKGEPVPSPSAGSLDPSQLDAVRQGTEQELAIIQGPPGTGKTFTSVVTIDSHLRTMQACHQTADPPPPIVVAAETNHALDQLLSQCIKAGISSIVRLGHGIPDEELASKSLRNLCIRSKVRLPEKKVDAKYKKAARALSWDLTQYLGNDGYYDAQDLLRAELISPQQYKSLTEDDEWETTEAQNNRGSVAKWLNDSVGKESSRKQSWAKPGPNQAGVYPNYTPFGASMPKHLVERDGGNDNMNRASHLLSCNSDLYQIPPCHRGHVYCLLHKRMQEHSMPSLLQAIRVFDIKCDEFKRDRWCNDAAVIHGEGIGIVGCTTTGLVKYRGLLEALKPRIMVVEEAAEAREGKIVAGLIPSIEQLVLVGDHQQLIPSVDIWELGKSPHRVNISLFERMVKLRIPFCSLRVQRRMAPALRQVVQAFYPHLEDHASVSQKLPVPGMGSRRIWWFDHQSTQKKSITSFENSDEADMIIGFIFYLTQNGVPPSRITVLAYYSGQVALIQKRLKRHQKLALLDFERSVRTIDGFQGEENDIILLSLVRGPGSDGSRGKVGFLADENRAVVALSRARCGLYIFGNMQNALSTSRSYQTWNRICKAFQDCVGTFLPVVCSSHHNQINVRQASDWLRIFKAGCGAKCNGQCGQERVPGPISPTVLATQAWTSKRRSSPSSPSPKGDRLRMQYETSDAIMDKGSRMFLFANGCVDGNEESTMKPEETLVDDVDDEEDLLISFSQDSAPAKPHVDSGATTTLQGLWRLDTIAANDEQRRELYRKNEVERDGDGPKIRQKFVKTVRDANGSRRLASRSNESLL
ncbi:hypothetical protein CDD82_4488 [Ophiocordyceps australis]|uniref:Helicase ATP-binding domain-containing protein n=1 Tax=Ophiocordyceps australis TaxID=1399860 RepID=A0A2C5Z7G6_9HYPO|nr:hypothetical protein CDD82_4488 [Ophiocordyceps australis]